MLFTIFSVFYVLVAAAMIVLILMQRGDGANAGASFGGGASGTVFGARGAASFLTRTTAVLAALFFALSLGMGIYLSHHGVTPSKQQQLGVMAGVVTPATSSSAAARTSPNINALAPSAGTSAPASSVPVQQSEVPTAPVSRQPEVPAAPAKTSAPAASRKAPASSGAPAGSH